MKKPNPISVMRKTLEKIVSTIPIILIVFFVIFSMVAMIGYYNGDTSISDNTPRSLTDGENKGESSDGNVARTSDCSDDNNKSENGPDENSCPREQTETSNAKPENDTTGSDDRSSTSYNGDHQAPASTQQSPVAGTPDVSTPGISKEDMSGCWKLDGTSYAVMCYKGNMQGVNYKWSSAYMEILNGKIITTEKDGWWPSGQIYGWSKYLGSIFGDAKLMSSKYSAKYQKPKLYITFNGVTYGFTKVHDTVSHPMLSSSFLDTNGVPYSKSSTVYNETTISVEPGSAKTIYLHKEKGWFFDLRIWENINISSSVIVEFLGKNGDDYAFRITVPQSAANGPDVIGRGVRTKSWTG